MERVSTNTGGIITDKRDQIIADLVKRVEELEARAKNQDAMGRWVQTQIQSGQPIFR